ncbi:hypothetical protein PInf_020305 [Phytophthora infestans]|nr:hypothetical protein PInf_020305 [Phytophthora infestans]
MSGCSLYYNNDNNENSCNTASNQEENAPEQIQFEKLETKLALQRQEMAPVLEQTSFLAVKTMELVVQDYAKHVIKALAALGEAIRVQPSEYQRELHGCWSHLVGMFPRLQTRESSDVTPFGDRAVVLVTNTLMILALTSIYAKANQLQYSWNSFTDKQRSNSQGLVQIVQLAVEVCAQ